MKIEAILLPVLAGAAAAMPIDGPGALAARGFNPVAVKPLGNIAKNAIAAGIANSGQWGPAAASAGALNMAQGVSVISFSIAGGSLVGYKLAEAIENGEFDGFGGPETKFGKWLLAEQIRGQERKKALIGSWKRAASWFERTFIPRGGQRNPAPKPDPPKWKPKPVNNGPKPEPEFKLGPGFGEDDRKKRFGVKNPIPW